MVIARPQEKYHRGAVSLSAERPGYCTISFNSAGIVTRDGPTEILVSADAKSGRDIAKIFGSLPPEAAKIYAYRFVTENNFGRSP